MFHAGGHKGVGTRGRASGFGRNYPHFLAHVDWKAPLRCGILFCTFACILFVIGVILTWLGIRRRVHDVFGESVPITGPILLAVGSLMLLLASRQFYLAHVRKKAHAKALECKELGETKITAINEEGEDHEDDDEGADLNKNKGGIDDTCVSFGDSSEKPPLISSNGYDTGNITSTSGDTYCSGGYIWPPASIQSPYYSMAMMVYKDPIQAYGISASHIAGPGTTETYSSSTGPVVATGSDLAGLEDGSAAMATETSALLPSSSQAQDSAVLETPSTTLSQQASTSSTASGQESSKIFPADYLPFYQKGGSNSASASAGISNLPNPTAFMMLRTLEVQETI